MHQVKEVIVNMGRPCFLPLKCRYEYKRKKGPKIRDF